METPRSAREQSSSRRRCAVLRRNLEFLLTDGFALFDEAPGETCQWLSDGRKVKTTFLMSLNGKSSLFSLTPRKKRLSCVPAGDFRSV